MIDKGLLVSMVAVVGAVALGARVWPPRLTRAAGVIGASSTAVIVGVAAARLTAVLIDDPSALSRPRDLLVIRGGMEFWPGVVAGVVAIAVGARKDHLPVLAELADLAPYGLTAYAVYEVTCVFRDGCFGPLSPVGLRPGGAGPVEFPVGIAVGVLALLLAYLVRQISHRHLALSLTIGVAGLGLVRAVAAIWLPRIGSAPSRPQTESAAVTLAAVLAVGAAVAAWRREGFYPAPSGSVDDGPNHGDSTGHRPADEQVLEP